MTPSTNSNPGSILRNYVFRYFPPTTFASIVVVIMLKLLVFDKTILGRQIETMSYALLQSAIPGKLDDSVRVIDVSSLPPQEGPQRVTNRRILTTLVDALIAVKASAIVLDIDFSPFGTTPPAVDDPRLLADWKKRVGEARTDSGVPMRLVVGVNRTGLAEKPSGWLYTDELKTLAASTRVRTAAPRYYVAYQIEAAQQEAWLPGIARAASPEPVRYLSHEEIVKYINNVPRSLWNDEIGLTERTSDGSSDKVYFINRLVDFRYLAHLRDNNRVTKIADANHIIANAKWYEGKVVLIGAVEEATDHFSLPLISDVSVPGVLFHACACATELNGFHSKKRLKEFTGAARIYIDFVISLVAFIVAGSVFWLANHYADRRAKQQGKPISQYLPSLDNHIRLDFVFGALVLGTAWVLLAVFQILWTDFLFVTAAIMLHSTLGVFLNIFYRMFAAFEPFSTQGHH